MPCLGPLHFSHIADHLHDYCPLSERYSGHYVLGGCVEHTSFHFGVGSNKFVMAAHSFILYSRHFSFKLCTKTNHPN